MGQAQARRPRPPRERRAAFQGRQHVRPPNSICPSYSSNKRSLVNFKEQEKYYTKIVDRYMEFCAVPGQRDDLLRRFASLELKETSTTPTTSTAESLTDPANAKTLSILMAALRKLREGIVASKRADDFALQAYLFCIRLSILIKQPESYHPAILHLLRVIHAQHPLSTVELQEVVCYLILDTACRRHELAEAYGLRRAYKVRDLKIDAALSALAHDNYIVFHRVRKSVDGHRARLMEWAEQDLRVHTLKCFGRSYMSVDLKYLEQSTNVDWAQLTRDGVGWELENEKVTIRRVRAK